MEEKEGERGKENSGRTEIKGEKGRKKVEKEWKEGNKIKPLNSGVGRGG